MVDHTWWRKYDSSSGRWTSPDPYRGSMTIANPQSFNRYTYTQNDPVNFVDPTGLAFVKVCVWWATHDVTNPTNPIQTGRPYLVCSDVWIPDGPVGGRQSGGTRHHPQGGRPGPRSQEPKPNPTPTPKPKTQAEKQKIYDDCFHREMAPTMAKLDRMMKQNLVLTVLVTGLALSKTRSVPGTMVTMLIPLTKWRFDIGNFGTDELQPAQEKAKETCKKEAGL